MILCYHTIIGAPWTVDHLHKKAAVLPDFIRERIIRKRKHPDVQLSISGYLLLLEIIKHFDADVTLHDIVHSPYKRPQFNTDFDFNISHSGNRVICCATNRGTVGVDLELVKLLDIMLEDYFTATERQNISAANNYNNEIINYWTRKEAVLKAIGTGLFTPLLDIDTATDTLAYQQKSYHLKKVDIDLNYRCSIAYTVPQHIQVNEVKL